MLRASLVVAGVLACGLPVPAQDSSAPDPHLQGERSAALFRRSAFAHGYIHGYEDGFSIADTNVHMGQRQADVEDLREYKRAGDAHRPHFGPRKWFRQGYREGFRAGYHDSFRGTPFRAIHTTRAAGSGFEEYTAPRPEPTFDAGFSEGYRAGRNAGLATARAGASVHPAAQVCGGDGSDRVSKFHSQEYCEAFRRGHALGYADGQNAPPEPAAERARR